MAAVRKEISKDDYKFFIGRVEKIGNGQVEFIADTQKKAIELLGEKIPQNVIDAENNYKAFNIWLGSEINPIIVGEGGYKEEIRVIGDGYDFFEVKAEKVSTAEVEIENAKAAEVEEISPSIEKIFAAVTTEIKPHIRGKYFVHINDNWREQEIRENFSTLEDAVKVARLMYSELCKVSRHIYATVEARTVDINKLWNRADDWTTFYEINGDGEKINRRETVDAIAKIDNRTVEEVRNDIGRCGDNYGFYKNSAPVEEANTEIIACLDDYIVNVDAAAEVEERNAEIAEGEIPVAVVAVVTVCESEIKAAVSKYNAIGEHFDDIMDVAVDEGLPNWEREQKKLIRKHYAAECKEKAKFLRNFFAGIGLPKKVLKVSVKYDYSDILGTVDYTIEISSKTEKIDADQLEKIAEYFEVDNRYSMRSSTLVEVCDFDFYEFEDVLNEDDAEIEINILPETTPDDTAEIEDVAVEEVNAEKNSLKAKVADLKATEKIISEKYLSLCRNLYVKIDGEYQSAVGFDDYVTKYHDTFYCKEGNDYVEDTAAYHELKEIEREWNALFKELEYFENIAEKAEVLKAKIAEQKNSRKSVIDWKATFEDMQVSEILSLQKDLKKFLKLGQIDLAENVFSMLKTLCKNYREQVAA